MIGDVTIRKNSNWKYETSVWAELARDLKTIGKAIKHNSLPRLTVIEEMSGLYKKG